MTTGGEKRSFVSRPADPKSWIRAGDAPQRRFRAAEVYTARLTIDVTPELRGRIKLAAFGRGVTVADMLRDLLSREFPDRSEDGS